MLRIILCTLFGAALTASGALAQPAKPASPLPAWRSQGLVIWTDAPDGKIKARVYASVRLAGPPVLVVWLHGDLGPGSEPYELTQQIAAISDNVIAAAILRPGYIDAEGDRSAGRKGRAIGDNYTAEVADDVNAAIMGLMARFQPSAVIVMGHSGGAGVAANLLGRHPETAAAAVLIACSCDPKGFMERWAREHPGVPKGLPNPSLSPLDLAPRVSPRTLVRMVVGSADTVVLVPPSQAYAAALKQRGVDVRLIVVPGADHVSVLESDAVHQAVSEVIAAEGGMVHPPTR
jgi:pimeloyl-ACP methyl ester carboxylesterase